MKVDKTNGCWFWTAGQNGSGYGTFNPEPGGAAVGAHRYAYQLLVGPIATGMTIDHLCRVRLCVRPDHMEIVPRAVNNARGQSPTAVNARKTHCPKGHEFTAANTYRWRNQRRCRVCQSERMKIWHLTH